QPLVIRNSKNVSISGLELDGQVNLMTKDTGVVEEANHGIHLAGVKGCSITDVNVHQFASDGIYIGTGGSSPNFKANRNVTLMNVKYLNNGRQALSIIQCVNAQFINCSFSETGITNGNYGSHAPQLGIDIEPNRGIDSVDDITRDIHFINCTIENNQGGMIASVLSDKIDNVSFTNCKMDAGEDNSYQYQIMTNTPRTVFDNCEINVRGGNVYPLGNSSSAYTLFKNSEIRSTNRGLIVSTSEKGKLVIDECLFKRDEGGETSTIFPYIISSATNAEVYFKNNTVFIPSSYYSNFDKGQT